MPDLGRMGRTYREYFNLAPYITKVKTVLVLGMSAGASVHELRHFFDVDIDAVDIDPEVIRLARRYFQLEEDDRLKIFAMDAKNFLIESEKRYDFVEIDLFHGGPEIPFYVTTREFFTQVHEHTSDAGVVMMNVIGDAENPRTNQLVLAVANTLSTVFSGVFLFNGTYNTLLLATRDGRTLDEIKDAMNGISERKLAPFGRNFGRYLRAFEFDSNQIVLTDDKAPVAYLTNQVLKESNLRRTGFEQ